MPNYLTREAALRVDGRRFVDLDLPELKGTLRLAEITLGPAQAMAALSEKAEAGDPTAQREMSVLTILHGVVDVEGRPLFDRTSAEQFYDSLPITAISKLVNGIPKDPAAMEQAKKIAADKEAAATSKERAIVERAAAELPAPPLTAIPSRDEHVRTVEKKAD